MKCGLVYLSQESCLVGDVSYHSYEGIVVEPAERERLGKDLGVHNKVSFSSELLFYQIRQSVFLFVPNLFQVSSKINIFK